MIIHVRKIDLRCRATFLLQTRHQFPREPAFSAAGLRILERLVLSHPLAERGLFLSDGDFYAMTVIERLGQAGVVRAGCACYTTEEEVERLLAAVRAV